MTQQPPPQQPQQPDGGSQHTVPLWYEQGQGQEQWQQSQFHYPQYPPEPPVASQAPAPGPSMPEFSPPSREHGRPAKSHSLAEVAVIAVVAAVLASAGTYALTRNNFEQAPAAQISVNAPTSPAPVAQANALAPDWAVTAIAVSPSVVAITVDGGQNGGGEGSGVILDSQGHILTNNHVVAAGGSGAQLTVTLADKRTYNATVVGTDASTDLAVIKLTNGPTDLKPMALGDANTIKVGDQVMAVGNPLGLAGTVTTGIISALNRPVTTTDQSTDPNAQQSADPVVTNAIQTSAAINPGNSGGALVNSSGQLIGINSAIASLGSSTDSSSQSGNIGIGFAIPVNEARSIANQLITTGTAAHPYLGVSSKDGVVAEGTAKRAAAVLTDVGAGTPADKAGLRKGDAIIAVNGNSIDGSLSLVAQVHELTVGQSVRVTVLRGGQHKSVTATLVAKPSP